MWTVSFRKLLFFASYGLHLLSKEGWRGLTYQLSPVGITNPKCTNETSWTLNTTTSLNIWHKAGWIHDFHFVLYIWGNWSFSANSTEPSVWKSQLHIIKWSMSAYLRGGRHLQSESHLFDLHVNGFFKWKWNDLSRAKICLIQSKLFLKLLHETVSETATV